MKNRLISGPPDSGKTSLIRNLAGVLGPRAGGFWTVSEWHNGMKVGYRIVTAEGRLGLLSHMTGVSLYRAGRFKVNIDDIDAVIVPLIRAAVETREIVLIDEIHRMTLFSEKFRTACLEALDSKRPVIATIQDRGHGFLDRLRARADAEILALSKENGETLQRRLLDSIGA